MFRFAHAAASSLIGVALERRGVDDVVAAGLRVEQGEAVVMLRRDDDVLHAGVLGELDPGVGVELHGVELRGECLVFAAPGIFARFMIHSPMPGTVLPFHSPAGMA